jgi:hypothetical protein
LHVLRTIEQACRESFLWFGKVVLPSASQDSSSPWETEKFLSLFVANEPDPPVRLKLWVLDETGLVQPNQPNRPNKQNERAMSRVSHFTNDVSQVSRTPKPWGLDEKWEGRVEQRKAR